MEVGKIPETVLKRSILKQIRHRRKEVLLGPGVGEDCSVIELKQGEVFVISADPITGTASEIGTLAVNITANDLAAGGAQPVGIMLTVLMPEETSEQDLKQIMREVEAACKDLNMEVIGGHTEITAVVNQPVISVAGVGKAAKDDIISTGAGKPGQDIVMTKWAGTEGTGIIAAEKRSELLQRFTEDYIDRARELIRHISIVKEAEIAKRNGACAMHDITEGGVFGALWELGEACGCGLEVNLKQIPIKQETVEICQFFDLNPYMLMSSGSLMIVTDNGSRMTQELEKEGISASVIGKMMSGHDKVVINDEERRYLEPPKSDELYKIC